MSFQIPNLADATWEEQARLFSTDLTILGMSAGGANGVVSGCAVTAQSPEAMAVDVASGSIVLANTLVTVTGNAVSITAANGTYARLDVIYVDQYGVGQVSTGTAAPAPVPNALPADAIGVAFVYVPANDTAIASNQVTDKRITVPTPLGSSDWTTLSKTADETRNSTTTLAVDDTLSFTMASNTKYRIRGHVVMWGDATPDGKWDFNGPSGASLVNIYTQRSPASDGSTPVVFADTTYNDVHTITGGILPISLVIDGVVHNGANGGDFEFRWAQAISDAGDTIVRAGSWLEYEVA